jgi:hypothetical protein
VSDKLLAEDKPKKLESVEQTLPQLPWKQKRGDSKHFWIPYIKLHETLFHPIPSTIANQR